jgi:hypothetical protein
MTTATSRTLRKSGLVMVAIAAVAMFTPMLVEARFGHAYDSILAICPFIWTICGLFGAACYFWGRYQYRQ